MKIFKHILPLILAAALVTSCHKDKGPSRQAVSTARSVLVYLGVDNNFRGEERQKIDNLRDNWSRDYDGNLLVYIDRGREPALVRIYNDGFRNVADTVILYPDASSDSADPAVFRGVIEDVRRGWPAASYGLVVLSHATGWLPKEVPANSPRSIIEDNSRKMDIDEFAGAIPDGFFDYIIFDACYMAGVEVIYELRNKTDWIVSSPAEVWAPPGFIYTSMMDRLMRPSPDLASVAYDFYYYWDNYSNPTYRAATVSVARTSEIEAVAQAAQAIIGGVNGEITIGVDTIQNFTGAGKYLYSDFAHYIRSVHEETGNGDIAAFDTALQRCVTSKYHTEKYTVYTLDQYPIVHFSGLTIYIPQAKYPVINTRYADIEWTQRVGTFIPPAS